MGMGRNSVIRGPILTSHVTPGSLSNVWQRRDQVPKLMHGQQLNVNKMLKLSGEKKKQETQPGDVFLKAA